MSVKLSKVKAASGWRMGLVFLLLITAVAFILTKLFSLYWTDQAFLQTQGDARSVRTMLIPAHRGVITDRNGEPLAISAPVASVWVDPKYLDQKHANLRRLSQLIDMPYDSLLERLSANSDRRFVYLRRQVTPEVAEAISALAIRGVNVDREYRRFYPAGEVTAHIVGFTNVDGEGQEGMELAYDDWLNGVHGSKLVMRDRTGRTIRHIRSIQDVQQGNELQLSIDLRLQHMAYRELKAVVEAHQADAGSIVIIDTRTGEVLAMANQPSYNPNDRSRLEPSALRNRAMTDLFEPGSTVKPMTVAAALMTGRYTPNTVVRTSPGTMRVRTATIRDFRNYGDLSLTGIITKSSNVGTVRLVMDMEHNRLPNLLSNIGFGQLTFTGFPGEQAGYLPALLERQVVERATMSYGYGLSVTPLQLAQSYVPFASDGIFYPVSLIKNSKEPQGTRVFPQGIGNQVLQMMETVIGPEGTARRAAVDGYRVAGKTGTVHRIGNGGYNREEYTAIFAGVAPVSNPRLAIAVMIDNPKGREIYGGEVAAPVFARVAAGSMRLLNLDPDRWPESTRQVVNR